MRLFRTRALPIITAIALLGAAVALVACGRNTVPRLSSAWPKANVERTVPAPPIPPKWPLTGLQAPDEASTQRRVLSIKIENSPEARPQTGVQDADVVYETVTEGGITRFNTLWQSKLPRVVGPVRSARLSDIWVVPQYRALFVYSGSSGFVASRLRNLELPDLSEDAGVTYPYFRSTERYSPHNLYLYPAKAYEEAARRKYKTKLPPVPLRFVRPSPETTITAKAVTVPFSTANTIRWVYDPAKKAYKRFNNGAPFIDASTGKQVTARNVVIMWTRYIPQRRDKWGSTTYDIDLGSSGRAVMLRDGQQLAAKWKGSRDAPPTFTDPNGKPLGLVPGNTWFQVVNEPVNVTIE